MSKLGRTLQPGDEALTDFDAPSVRFSRVRILDRSERQSQSGICFQVDGLRKSSGPDAWIDADWFEPMPDAPRMSPELAAALKGDGG